MKVVIRTDASLQIGTGHVMRSLTLAHDMKDDSEIEFICREHEGSLISYIQNQGFKVNVLPEDMKFDLKGELAHSTWLGATQQQDAEQCKPILESIKPDWLIVDHYALDKTWQALLKKTYNKLMVIDDLADRNHQCDLLLDQTYGRQISDYRHLVPEKCQMLLGSQYALLRPEFSEWRDYSLKRRSEPEFKKLLITMGGVDSDNVTCQVLEAIRYIQLSQDIEIIVVMGGTAPHLNEVKTQANSMPYNTKVMVNVNNMAERMANADLAIGAAGATTWERCCLGLPTIQMVISVNQITIAKQLAKNNAIQHIENIEQLQGLMQGTQKWMSHISQLASNVCDGWGSSRVLNKLIKLN